jgi:hypothetical protein
MRNERKKCTRTSKKVEKVDGNIPQNPEMLKELPELPNVVRQESKAHGDNFSRAGFSATCCRQRAASHRDNLHAMAAA